MKTKLRIKSISYLLILLLSNCSYHSSSYKYAKKAKAKQERNDRYNEKYWEKRRLIYESTCVDLTVLSYYFNNIPIDISPDSLADWLSKDNRYEPSKWKGDRPWSREYSYKLDFADSTIHPSADSIHLFLTTINYVSHDSSVMEWNAVEFEYIIHYSSIKSAELKYNEITNSLETKTGFDGIAYYFNGNKGKERFREWKINDTFYPEPNLHGDEDYFSLTIIDSYDTSKQVRLKIFLTE